MHIQLPECIHYAGIFILYSFSMAFSFLFAGLFIRPLSLKELKDDEEIVYNAYAENKKSLNFASKKLRGKIIYECNM